MSNLGLLLKVNIINEFGLNKIKNADKKEKKKLVGFILLATIGIASIGFYIFNLCFFVSDILIEMDKMELLLVAGFIAGMLFTLLTSMYKASSYLFESKDFDMLVSLPIKESSILASKILILIFSNYLFSLGFILIPAIVYFIKVDTAITYFPFLIILFLSAPLIPIVISSIISFFIGNISSKMKHKNLAMVGGSFVLLIVYIGVVTQMESLAQNILQNSTSIINAINKIYPPAYYFTDALKNNSIISLVLFLAISLVPFLIFLVVFSKGFKNINARMNETYKAKEYRVKGLNTSTPIMALLRKEISRYLSSYIYLLNTSFGMILLLIGTAGILVFGVDQINALLELNININILKPQMILIFIFMIATTCTTYCSISLEGKNLWIIKSSPIEEVDIFKSKILMNIILNIPIPVLSFLMIGFKLKFDIAFIIIMICTIVAVGIMVSISGLLTNLYFPNLDWKNEVAVVKRSVGLIIVLFGSMIYVAGFAIIYCLIKMPNLNMYLMVFAAATFGIDIILWNIIKTKGVKMFRAL